jgi:hypothetical protein
MFDGEVIFCDIKRTIEGEGNYLGDTDTEVLKRGERIGLETRVVHAVNDGCCICVFVLRYCTKERVCKLTR